MNRKLMMLFLAASVAGCGSSPQQTASSAGTRPVEPVQNPAPKVENPAPKPTGVSTGNTRVIASVNGMPITEDRFLKPLIEGYGLNVLLNVALLEQSRQLAERAKVTVTAEDFQQEMETTLSKTFEDARKEDYPQLLDQLLTSQGRSRADFELVVQTNAYLRKTAEPAVRNRITDEQAQEAFKALYGETVQTRHIEVSNLTEIAEAKRRLAAGEAFEKVAREMSRNDRTAGLGGEIRPFSRQATNIPDVFKEAAFSLKEGEVSDAVQVNGAYHLIKLEKRIPPKAIKFDDVKESLKLDLEDRLLQVQVRALRDQLKQQLRAMKINDPVLAKQFEEMLTKEDGKVSDRQQVLSKLEEERKAREAAATQPAATQPTTNTSTPEHLRPPATMPEAPASGPAK